MVQAIKPAPIPSLTDHPAYAAALDRRADLARLAVPIHDEINEIDAALTAMRKAEAVDRERRVSGRPGPSPIEVAADALLAGADRPRTAGKSKADLIARRQQLEFEADIVATAVRKFDQAEVEPARAAAYGAVVEAIVRDIWRPAVRRVGLALIAAAKARQAFDDLRVELATAGLLGAEFTHPLPYSRLRDVPADPNSLTAGLARGLIEGGFVDPADPALAGVRLK